MPRQVFVSHSSKDKDAADAVRAALEAAGVGCWIAPRDIPPGSDWSEAIVGGLIECAVTVLVFSENANASVQVRREVQFSFENGKTVVPFRIEDVRPTGAFAYYLNPVHWLSAFPPPLAPHLPPLLDFVRGVLGDPKAAEVLGRKPEPAAAPAPPPPPPVSAGHLPEPLAPLIGRERALAAWEALLRDPATRALTLVGFGGMGKSRSALELARRTAAAYPGGAWWVELDSARTEADLLERVAGVLHLEPSADVAAQVADRLRGAGGPALLVLDNTEQIDAASRAVAALLKAVPDLNCLTTSRRALEIAAEKLQEVEPLPQDEAEALFLDRARTRQADFERTAENAEDIAAVARALEGVPLAIEMAAARIGMMTPRDILARLTERFRLLQTRATHLPPRQRTLLEAVDWSYDLLTEDDRDLLGQVAVFHGGFTLEAAEAVCDVFDIFEGVDNLRRHSFLKAATDDRAQTRRFAMLEFLRAYAERKRDEQIGPEAGDAVRKRHARYYRDLAEEKVPLLRTADEREALAAVSAELENLRAALAFAERTGDHELCARLAAALSTPLHDLGYWDELSRVLASGLRAAEASGDDRRRAALALDVASLAHDRGDLDGARAGAESARALCEAAGDAPGLAEAENLLGLIDMDAGRYDEAEARLVSARDRRAPADHAGRAHALYNLARLASLRGDQARARALYEESLTPRRAAGDLRGEAKTLLSLGAVAYLADDPAAARAHYEAALGLLRLLGDVQGIATLLYNLGELAEKNGDAPRAIMLYHHAEERFRSLSSPLADLAKSELDRLQGALGDAAFAEARRAASECSWETLC